VSERWLQANAAKLGELLKAKERAAEVRREAVN
jgi:hypothetical protein